MAFGIKVTEFPQIAVGDYGYTIKINLTTYNFYKVNSVQAQAAAGDTMSPVTAESTIEVVQGYVSDADCPDLAFNYGGSLTIFFKTTAFPYVDNTRFAAFGLRNATLPTGDSSALDVPDKDLRLLLNYALLNAYSVKKGSTPRDILAIIEQEELRLYND